MLNSKRKANRFLLFSSDFFYTSACSWPGGILKAHSPAGERKRVTENLALVKVFVIDSERLSWGKKPSFFASNNIAKHPKHKQPENNRSHCLTWLEHVNAKNLAVSPTTWKSATWKSFSAYLTIQYNSWKWTAENKKALTNVNAVLLAEKLCTWRYKMATGKAVAIAHVWIWQNFPSPPPAEATLLWREGEEVIVKIYGECIWLLTSLQVYMRNSTLRNVKNLSDNFQLNTIKIRCLAIYLVASLPTLHGSFMICWSKLWNSGGKNLLSFQWKWRSLHRI